MNNTNTGGPAFPTTKPLEHWGDPNQGMTLRDYFAAKAMQSWVLATTKTYTHDGQHQTSALDIEQIAEYAYGQADAMLKAREA
jgi:hypothetical protein